MPKLILDEDTRQDWLNLVKKHKKKQKGLPALSKLNTNAGDVEHNLTMFNKMNTPVEGPSNNPISGPFGENIACSESLNEAASDKKETIELEYNNLEFTQYGNKHDVDNWDEWNRRMNWTYEVDKDDLYTFIFEYCIDELDFPLAFEDNFDPNNSEDWHKFESWLDNNFDTIFNKYKEKILAHWEEDACDEAAEEYDSSDYYEELNSNKLISEELDDVFDMSMRTLL